MDIVYDIVLLKCLLIILLLIPFIFLPGSKFSIIVEITHFAAVQVGEGVRAG